IATLKSELESARDGLRGLKQDEDELAAQERRFTDLAASSRELAGGISQRLETVQGLQAELGKAATIKEELLGELARVQSQERDTFAQLKAVEDQVKRLETLWKQLDQRREQLEEADQAMGRVDARMQELQRLFDDEGRRTPAG